MVPTTAAERLAVGDSVQLWLCGNTDLAEQDALDLERRWLDERERATARRFVFDHDRSQYLVAHALVRRVLALHTGVAENQLGFWRSHRGRPFLEPPVGGWPYEDEGIDFNLSHTRGVNVIAVTSHRRIGVDVERLDREDVKTIDAVAEAFSPEEQQWLAGLPDAARRRGVLRLWTLKEAYAKARGLGLALPFDSFGFALDGERLRSFRPPRDDLAGRWQFVELEPMASTLLAAAVEVVGPDIPEVHLRTGFPWTPEAPLVLDMPVRADLEQPSRILR
ncbi:4'-phosphopantetheinyl transferase family protein [Lentzea sp. NPDC051213]|uniref:4'-phosphopantetheinyl transferase family protein n=1 Tax=Lentzea sp. NPDC051213 TaxID=3364126 RepID=UPI0037A4FA51